MKQLVLTFSCAYIELWMHLGSLEVSRALQTFRVHPQLDYGRESMNQSLI